ncbi:peptidase S1 and S6 chymotrypsin/Hap [Halogeometricum pallidum JCM 14848]|uniref:Peptidase S1 and S6 chymotrypsin/Hap n=1 Tax=Halogeometricum pallidum JCM 14848 TaxID=1227487 RepID=M0CTQ1_HALPD|nr:trypsin-like peptidase domain-containing protein [Halogeometricum pallidum]ELZ26581.1 peptidase S1 and S6 chymotrypsin/Hap [Halogeometricum pallidum JCM 14848]
MHADEDFEQLYRDVIPSVVSLYVGRRAPGVGAGSGFVYDDRHVVTNEHVVGNVEEVELRFADGSWAVGEVVGTDAYTDLAVVAVDGLPESATPLPVAPENPLPGRPVAALGNPLGLDGSITAGIVSGANRSMPTSGGFSIPDVVQTDAPINPGNSGGPLVAVYVDGDEADDDGAPSQRYEVVGVNRAKQGDNIGFAVSPTIVNRIVPSLVSAGRYPHSYLRARMLDVTPAVAEANGLDDPRGVLVVEVTEGPRDGDALRGCRDRRTVRGQRVPIGGDVVVGIGDGEVRSHEELMRYLITETRPDEPVDIEVIREGSPETLTVVLDERPPVESKQRRGRRRKRRRGERDGGDGRGGVDIPVR